MSLLNGNPLFSQELGANSLCESKVVQALRLPAMSYPPPTDSLSVPRMDPTISYLQVSHMFFPLQRKILWSSPISAFTMDLIVEEERWRQVEVNQIKVFHPFLSNYFQNFNRPTDGGGVGLPGIRCLKSCGWRFSRPELENSQVCPVTPPGVRCRLVLSALHLLTPVTRRSIGKLQTCTWPASLHILPQRCWLIFPSFPPWIKLC